MWSPKLDAISKTPRLGLHGEADNDSRFVKAVPKLFGAGFEKVMKGQSRSKKSEKRHFSAGPPLSPSEGRWLQTRKVPSTQPATRRKREHSLTGETSVHKQPRRDLDINKGPESPFN